MVHEWTSWLRTGVQTVRRESQRGEEEHVHGGGQEGINGVSMWESSSDCHFQNQKRGWRVKEREGQWLPGERGPRGGACTAALGLLDMSGSEFKLGPAAWLDIFFGHAQQAKCTQSDIGRSGVLVSK